MSGVLQEAVFIGANKQSFAVDYNPQDNVVAYGAGKTVALWTPTGNNHKGVDATLKHHTKEITCVKFIPNSDYLVSCAEDQLVCIWQKNKEKNHHNKQNQQDYNLVKSFEGHSGSITCIAVLNSYLFATGGSDGFVKLWNLNSSDWTQLHAFQVKQGFYPLSLALQDIRPNQFILAIGGTNFNLYVYSFVLDQSASSFSGFTQSAVLTGHEDWIKCLSFTKEHEDDFLLASGSQDRYIRLWRLRLDEKIDNSDEDSSKLILLSNKQYKFNISNTKAAFSFEALIMGHDDWVTGLAWNPNNNKEKLQLLSSSADTALMIWEMDQTSGIWVCITRLGELSIKGASTATGASGGFWSCTWFNNGDCQYILTNGKTGSIRAYKCDDINNWEATLSITGPYKEVTDLVWSKGGDYFMATSLDQTTRLMAPWSVNKPSTTWHEFARPQIHGYDMIALDNITPTKFVSGGDEKILRVFEMTDSIHKLLKRLAVIEVDAKEDLPDTAALPVLGLSNKAANEQLEAGEEVENQDQSDKHDIAADDILADLTTPPLEDHLQRFTLFPELEKLYGHGYEITCCATSPSGTLIASACKSNSTKHGMLRVFNVKNDYQQCEQTLPGHNLTVTNVAFSPNGQYLLSVSRDRQFILWKVVDEETGAFEMVETNAKAHTRIIWDCDWLPFAYGKLFITVGRDKQLKVWEIENDQKVVLVNSLKLDGVITAVTCYKTLIENKAIVAIGLESGDIQLLTIDLGAQDKPLKVIEYFDSTITPADKVTTLKFSHKAGELLLAAGSSDSSIRLYKLRS